GHPNPSAPHVLGPRSGTGTGTTRRVSVLGPRVGQARLGEAVRVLPAGHERLWLDADEPVGTRRAWGVGPQLATGPAGRVVVSVPGAQTEPDRRFLPSSQVLLKIGRMASPGPVTPGAILPLCMDKP